MCGNTELFFKNKRQKSLECVKNIISLHQLSWNQSFYLKERLIPIEDLKRSPVKAVAFFLPYISEFCDNRGKRIRNFVIFTTKTYGILWFSSRFPLEFCDKVLCKTASSIPSPTSWPSCSNDLWGEKDNKNPCNKGDNAIGLVTEPIASSLF